MSIVYLCFESFFFKSTQRLLKMKLRRRPSNYGGIRQPHTIICAKNEVKWGCFTANNLCLREARINNVVLRVNLSNYDLFNDY